MYGGQPLGRTWGVFTPVGFQMKFVLTHVASNARRRPAGVWVCMCVFHWLCVCFTSLHCIVQDVLCVVGLGRDQKVRQCHNVALPQSSWHRRCCSVLTAAVTATVTAAVTASAAGVHYQDSPLHVCRVRRGPRPPPASWLACSRCSACWSSTSFVSLSNVSAMGVHVYGCTICVSNVHNLSHTRWLHSRHRIVTAGLTPSLVLVLFCFGGGYRAAGTVVWQGIRGVESEMHFGSIYNYLTLWNLTTHAAYYLFAVVTDGLLIRDLLSSHRRFVATSSATAAVADANHVDAYLSKAASPATKTMVGHRDRWFGLVFTIGTLVGLGYWTLLFPATASKFGHDGANTPLTLLEHGLMYVLLRPATVAPPPSLTASRLAVSYPLQDGVDLVRNVLHPSRVRPV